LKLRPVGGKGDGKAARAGKEALARLSAAIAAASQGEDVGSKGKPVELDLSTLHLYPEGAEELVSAILNDSSCPLQVLNVCNARLGNKGAIEIFKLMNAGHPPLRSLDLRMNRIGEAAAEQLGAALKTAQMLTTLYLSSNNLGPIAAAEIAAALEVSSSLEYLAMDYSQIGDAGAKSLADGLKKNATLKTLLLRCGEFNTSGAVCIADALRENKTLTALDVSTNEIRDQGAEAFSDALSTNHIMIRLDMFDCEVGPACAAAVRAALFRNEEALSGSAPVISDA
jgi:Ran GTPase-activating protein (RanGAP) involved in mRNA processing and transport